MGRTAGVLAFVCLLLATFLIASANPAEAGSWKFSKWGQFCAGDVCLPEGVLYLTVDGPGNRIHGVRTSWDAAAGPCVEQWWLEIRVYSDSGGEPERARSEKVDACQRSGRFNWVPPGGGNYFPTGGVCVVLMRGTGVRVHELCAGLNPGGGRVWFKNWRSLACLDADANNGLNGTVVQGWRCNGTAQQRWLVNPNMSIESRRFRGMCLDADTNTLGGNGTRVQLWACNGSPQQKWVIWFNGRIQSVASGRALDLDPRDNRTVRLWDGNWSGAQAWVSHG